jgi:hypothetical protein
VPIHESTNKLWHYYVTLAKAYQGRSDAPRYFIWLLVLPDSPVANYQIWDLDRRLGFFNRKFRKPFAHLIRQSPYRFYDPMIKLAARQFLTRRLQLTEGLSTNDGRCVDVTEIKTATPNRDWPTCVDLSSSRTRGTCLALVTSRRSRERRGRCPSAFRGHEPFATEESVTWTSS